MGDRNDGRENAATGFAERDILLLASATWNTGSIEGQLNPHMWELLKDKAKNLDLAGKRCAGYICPAPAN
jgi:hypothetical protein